MKIKDRIAALPLNDQDEYTITRGDMADLIRQVFGLGLQVGLGIIQPPEDPGGQEQDEDIGGGSASIEDIDQMENVLMLDALHRRRKAA